MTETKNTEVSTPDFEPETDTHMAQEQPTPVTGQLKTFTMETLYETAYAAKAPIAEGLLYPGLYLFAGAPKIGKSFCMSQIAYHVSRGLPLWVYQTTKCKVLYLALEDTEERIQNRLFRMFGAEISETLYFCTTADKIGSGLLDLLGQFVKENPDTRLIIIDTLQKIRKMDADTYSYAADYDVIGKLKQFADAHRLCMLLVHHTRKQEADDKTQMISGTTGLFGAADGAFIMYKRKRVDNEVMIEVSGRDLPDQRLLLRKNPDTMLLELQSVNTALWKEAPDGILERVNDLLTEESPEWFGTASDLAERIAPEMKANALSYHLNVNAARLFREYHIQYEKGRSHARRAIRLTRCPSESNP